MGGNSNEKNERLKITINFLSKQKFFFFYVFILYFPPLYFLRVCFRSLGFLVLYVLFFFSFCLSLTSGRDDTPDGVTPRFHRIGR
jgi:hypothetical protein